MKVKVSLVQVAEEIVKVISKFEVLERESVKEL
jgi:hypothetical protein